jgi:hypothetical protein
VAIGTAQSTILPPPPPVPGESLERERLIRRQLARTSLQVRLVDLASGFAVWIIGVLLLFLFAALVDHLVGLGLVGRYLALSVLVAGSIWYLVLEVGPLLVRAINPAYAARTIEEATPTLKNSLINFLLLKQDRSHVREIVYQAVERQAAADIATVPVEATVDRSRLIYAGYVLCGIMAVIAAYKILSPKDPFQTAARVLAPWADIARPSRVQIVEVQPGNKEIYYGQTVTISATIRGVRDGDSVNVLYTTADGQAIDRPVPMKLSAGDQYECTLPPADATSPAAVAGIQQDITYRLLAGDAESGHYRLMVVSAPTIIVERLEYQFPAYTKKPAESVEQHGDIKALEGTKVTVRAIANQLIKSAWIEFDPAAGEAAPEVFPLAADGDRARGTITLLLRPDRQTPWHASYQVRFHNDRQEKSQQPILHKIEVLPDLPPEVQIVKPDRARIEVPENGELTIEVRGVDPDFGLSSMRFEGTAAGRPPIKVEMLSPDAGNPPQAVVPFAFRPREHKLVARDELQYTAVAEDNRTNPQTGQPEPNAARSRQYTIVVAPPQKIEQGKASQGKASQDQRPMPGGEQKNQPGNPPPKDQQQPDKNQKAGEQQNENNGQGNQQSQPMGDRSNQEKSQQPGQEQQPKDQKDEQQKGQQQKQQGGQSKQQSGEQQKDQQQGEQQKGDQNNQQQTGQQQGNQQGGQQGGQQSGSQQAGGESNQQQQQKGQSGGQQGGGSKQQSEQQSGGDKNNASGGEQSKSGEQRGDGDGQGKAEHDGQAIERVWNDLKKRFGGSQQNDGNQSASQQQGDEGQSQQQSGADSSKQGDKAKAQPKADSQQKNGENQKAGSDPGGQAQKSGSSGAQNQNVPNAGRPEKGDQQGDQQKGQPQQSPGKKGDASDRLPDDKEGQNDTQQPSGGNKGGAPRGPMKTDQGEKSSQEKSEQRDPGAGRTGDEGAGTASDDKTGSGEGTKKNQDRPKDTKPDSNQAEKGDPSPASSSQKQSDSKGGDSGQDSGGGKKGAGQSAGQQGNDSAGRKSAADQGAGQANETGSGDVGSKAGQQKKAEGKTGQSGNQAGDGTDSRQGNQQPGAKGQQPSKDDAGKGKPKSDTQQSSKGGGNNDLPVGGKDDDSVRFHDKTEAREEIEADAANLEYARKATEMVLKHLKDEENNPDPELLDKLGWSREELAEFIRRWDALQKSANQSPDGKRELDEALKSLGLRDPNTRKRAGGKTSDNQRDLRDAGNRSSPPPRYRELFDAFRKGAARSTP